MPTPLTSAHVSTYEAVLRHPAPLDLKWQDVQPLLAAISEAFEEHAGGIRARRGGQLLALRRARGKEIVDRREMAQIRSYLERSGPLPRRSQTDAAPA